ncbi:TrmH family RNA methyltransferase [Conexibacter sp. JD483]|uniref:TrmH family RNA methyltransferase n=1 Tax=unclassified Conexibacter TaxID=2627773 RepID=UPI002722A103|nr:MULTISPECIES: TrmH family RNA methyltransferase [unclassified Conexibacter]MDO8186619.1 TrmH family RNA methyltransferase [Conexibacter sp. CPCC 205706]MDO8196724.1 TrmH family RNA methyltransferase [Conexibacter sp. CPCC 205762]MDR9370909.1 TrmH family RNA methyltransferase [Conexibacter sp. JD483]
MTNAALAASFAAARDDASLAILEGFHTLKHALRFGASVTHAVTSDPATLAELTDALAPDVGAAMARLVTPMTPAELRALGFPRPPHTGIVAIARRPAFSLPSLLQGEDAPVVLLEDPRHLGNVGAVVRVAAAAGAAGVVTTGARDPWDPAALRGAAGLHFALPVGRVGDGVAAGGRDAVVFDPSPRPLVALDPEGEPLGSAPLPAGAVLAFGTERHGLSDALLARADMRVRIPMRDGVSSLNLATAVAAVLYTSSPTTLRSSS